MVQLISDVAGMTTSEADEIRRAFNRPNSDHLVAMYRLRFLERALGTLYPCDWVLSGSPGRAEKCPEGPHVRLLHARSAGAPLTRTGEELTGLADAEHFGPTDRAYAPGCRAAVLHGYLLRVFHIPGITTLHTIALHQFPPCTA